MRIPHTISENILKTYETTEACGNQNLFSDNFCWDDDFVRSLRAHCLVAIAKNWETRPLYTELLLQPDRSEMVDYLSCNLPLGMTVDKIEEDFFWERSFVTRWPSLPPPNRQLCAAMQPFSRIIRNESLESEKSDATKTPDEISPDEIDTELNETMQSKNVSSSSDSEMKPDISVVRKTWKTCFLEKFLQDELENMKPSQYNPEYIKELTSLCGSYVLTLNLRQLLCSDIKDSVDHISLHSLLTRLPNLVEFTICFTQGNLVDNFSWHPFEVSLTDCQLLAKGLEKTRVQILRILRSNVDHTKLAPILESAAKMDMLRVIDLSNCKLGDEAARLIGELLKERTSIENVALVNNLIGPNGAQALAECLPDSNLVNMNLRLNPLGKGGRFIVSGLKNTKRFKSLSLSACDLSNENFDIEDVLSTNTLETLDLSNNVLGKDIGASILKGLQNNTSMLHLDLRMCDVPYEIIFEIDKILRNNWKISNL